MEEKRKHELWGVILSYCKGKPLFIHEPLSACKLELTKSAYTIRNAESAESPI